MPAKPTLNLPVATVHKHPDYVTLRTPYDPDFLASFEDLRRMLPYHACRWYPDRKLWIIQAKSWSKVVGLLRIFFKVEITKVDDTSSTPRS